MWDLRVCDCLRVVGVEVVKLRLFEFMAVLGLYNVFVELL